MAHCLDSTTGCIADEAPATHRDRHPAMKPPAATGRPKLIYFAERRTGFDRDGFRERWRQHARLGMSMERWSNVHRYAHCDSVEATGTGLPVAWCDGVAMVWYRSEEARLNHLSDRTAATVLKRDERETFARPVRDVSVLTGEHVFRPCDSAPMKLFLRVWAHPDRPRRDFRDWWLRAFGPRFLMRLDENEQGCGYVQNHARASASADDPPPLCDCVDEIACADAGRTGASIQEALAGLADMASYVADIKAIWTNETVLYSR